MLGRRVSWWDVRKDLSADREGHGDDEPHEQGHLCHEEQEDLVAESQHSYLQHGLRQCGVKSKANPQESNTASFWLWCWVVCVMAMAMASEGAKVREAVSGMVWSSPGRRRLWCGCGRMGEEKEKTMDFQSGLFKKWIYCRGCDGREMETGKRAWVIGRVQTYVAR